MPPKRSASGAPRARLQRQQQTGAKRGRQRRSPERPQPLAAVRTRPGKPAGLPPPLRPIVAALRSGIQALSIGGALDTLVGRERELAQIEDFLCASGGEPTLQLFGLPGTGKTAAVHVAIARARRHLRGAAAAGVAVCFLNGYIMQRATEVYTALYHQLSADRLGAAAVLPPEQAQTQLERRFRTGWGRGAGTDDPERRFPLCVIVVDEVDRCCDKSAKTLFRLVDWMTLPHAHCKLVTIANKFNLPEQLDAKTRSRLNTTSRVTFASYTADQLRAIVDGRIGHLRPRVVAPSALTYLCALVAGHFGDTRRLLQTAASSLHARLIQIEEDGEVEEGNGVEEGEKGAMKGKERGNDSGGDGGLVEIKHMRSIVRNTFHDPFGEFIKDISAPLPFLACGVIALETRRCDAAHASPRLDALFLYNVMLRTIEKFRVVMELTPAGTLLAAAPAAKFFSVHDWFYLLEPLWQIKLITVVVGTGNDGDGEGDDDGHAVSSVDDCLSAAAGAPVLVTMEQPFEMVIAGMELHERWGNIAVKLFRNE